MVYCKVVKYNSPKEWHDATQSGSVVELNKSLCHLLIAVVRFFTTSPNSNCKLRSKCAR